MGFLTTAQKEALSSGRVQIANMAELNFGFGTERYWSGLHTLNYASNDWVSTGNLGKITSLESSQELRANGVELSIFLPMDGSLTKPVTNFQNVKSSEYKGRSARLMLAFFDEEFQTPIYVMERNYFMDSLEYNIHPRNGASITLRLESELLAKGKRRVKRWTDTQQRDEYPDDNAFQFLSYLSSGVQVKWGASGAFFQ